MRGPLHVIINNTGGENGNNNQSGALPIRAISLKKQPTDGSVIAVRNERKKIEIF